MFNSDTIAAIATSLNSSGIGIIRISGPDSVFVVDKIYKGNKKLSEVESHTINYGHIVDNDEIIDEVLVSVMLSPRSYTTEDVVEINCHGGVLVLKKVLGLIFKNGARLAEPGEFTKRAFLNGRIDLSEAEAVMDIISSDSELALKNSVKQLSGALKNKIINIRENIIHECAYIEAALDDPEHYDLDGYDKILLQKINNYLKEIEILKDSFSSGRIMKNGIRTVIVGKPNAGKSSVLNLLTNSNRAIVTDIPGTTRDTIEEQINIKGISLNIIDTAGIRSTSDTVEKIGIEKAFDEISDADLILYIVDSSSDLNDDDYEIINKIKNKKSIIIYNKTDKSTVVSKEDILSKIDKDLISFSAKTSDGLEELKACIYDMFVKGIISSSNEVSITNERQYECLVNSYNSLMNTCDAIESGMTEDVYTVDMMDAYTSLGLIIGEAIEDDLANKIFSDFCMGK